MDSDEVLESWYKNLLSYIETDPSRLQFWAQLIVIGIIFGFRRSIHWARRGAAWAFGFLSTAWSLLHLQTVSLWQWLVWAVSGLILTSRWWAPRSFEIQGAVVHNSWTASICIATALIFLFSAPVVALPRRISVLFLLTIYVIIIVTTVVAGFYHGAIELYYYGRNTTQAAFDTWDYWNRETAGAEVQLLTCQCIQTQEGVCREEFRCLYPNWRMVCGEPGQETVECNCPGYGPGVQYMAPDDPEIYKGYNMSSWKDGDSTDNSTTAVHPRPRPCPPCPPCPRCPDANFSCPECPPVGTGCPPQKSCPQKLCAACKEYKRDKSGNLITHEPWIGIPPSLRASRLIDITSPTEARAPTAIPWTRYIAVRWYEEAMPPVRSWFGRLFTQIQGWSSYGDEEEAAEVVPEGVPGEEERTDAIKTTPSKEQRKDKATEPESDLSTPFVEPWKPKPREELTELQLSQESDLEKGYRTLWDIIDLINGSSILSFLFWLFFLFSVLNRLIAWFGTNTTSWPTLFRTLMAYGSIPGQILMAFLFTLGIVVWQALFQNMLDSITSARRKINQWLRPSQAALPWHSYLFNLPLRLIYGFLQLCSLILRFGIDMIGDMRSDVSIGLRNILFIIAMSLILSSQFRLLFMIPLLLGGGWWKNASIGLYFACVIATLFWVPFQIANVSVAWYRQHGSNYLLTYPLLSDANARGFPARSFVLRCAWIAVNFVAWVWVNAYALQGVVNVVEFGVWLLKGQVAEYAEKGGRVFGSYAVILGVFLAAWYWRRRE